MLNWFFRIFNKWVILGTFFVLVFLCSITFGIFKIFQSQNPDQAAAVALLTVIPAPTITPTSSDLYPTPTQVFISENGIFVGAFVQISGTEGEGLRLRSGPGLNHAPRFLGMDAEVYEVKDGPKFSDGFTWWYLVAPYDQTRSGWAASEYLSLVPTDTPDQ